MKSGSIPPCGPALCTQSAPSPPPPPPQALSHASASALSTQAMIDETQKLRRLLQKTEADYKAEVGALKETIQQLKMDRELTFKQQQKWALTEKRRKINTNALISRLGVHSIELQVPPASCVSSRRGPT